MPLSGSGQSSVSIMRYRRLSLRPRCVAITPEEQQRGGLLEMLRPPWWPVVLWMPLRGYWSRSVANNCEGTENRVSGSCASASTTSATFVKRIAFDLRDDLPDLILPSADFSDMNGFEHRATSPTLPLAT